MKIKKAIGLALGILLTAGIIAGCGGEDKKAAKEEAKEFLNVSYDPTRELYAEFNKEFTKVWKHHSGKDMTFSQSNGGSGKQARSVIEGLEADVVTLALAYDVDEIAQAGLIKGEWLKKFPNNSAPYTSTIVFLVRKGNPKNIKDWDDLIKDGVGVITPNPKTSGGARWNYLAAWEFARRKYGDDNQAKEFVKKLFGNVVVLDSGARGSTTSFTQRGQGDVLLAWENEALITLKDSPDYEIVIPSISILAEPSVAVVDEVVDKKGTREVAEAYINYLYDPAGQEIAAKNFYRPRNKEVFEKYKSQFPDLKLFTIDDAFGGWTKAQKEHFADGGTFDQIYTK
ncbi:MAG: sulfate ABC transporter substrate-binding protein [Selenomonadaceae bacterium]|nr:sulfate ABC transporter substrate-binding protein [Selenomonadaceae bacterium]MBP3721650.1 sulfate ABC transporter substrate-binding protein [Selenomonadaceae bacterium]